MESEKDINGCPAATQDVSVNLKNRQHCIDVANYGPLNPFLPNNAYWTRKGKQFKTTAKDAKTARCANCAVFIQTPEMLDCINKGIEAGDTSPQAWDIIHTANLGYCEMFDFKCAGERTCDAWVAGGPITKKVSKNG